MTRRDLEVVAGAIRLHDHDFEVVAGAIRLHNHDYVLDPLAVSMANAFALRFTSFDKQRFLKACDCSALTLLAQRD